MDRKESSSGAPRKIEGMKSRKVWVMAMEVMKMASVKGEVRVKRNGENERRIIEIRFIWMPGIRPVIVPKVTPSNRATVSSNIATFSPFCCIEFAYFLGSQTRLYFEELLDTNFYYLSCISYLKLFL